MQRRLSCFRSIRSRSQEDSCTALGVEKFDFTSAEALKPSNEKPKLHLVPTVKNCAIGLYLEFEARIGLT